LLFWTFWTYVEREPIEYGPTSPRDWRLFLGCCCFAFSFSIFHFQFSIVCPLRLSLTNNPAVAGNHAVRDGQVGQLGQLDIWDSASPLFWTPFTLPAFAGTPLSHYFIIPIISLFSLFPLFPSVLTGILDTTRAHFGPPLRQHYKPGCNGRTTVRFPSH